MERAAIRKIKQVIAEYGLTRHDILGILIEMDKESLEHKAAKQRLKWEEERRKK